MVGLQSQYAVQRLGTDPKHRFLSESDYALKTLARETGAQAFFPSEVGQLKGIYASIATELANQVLESATSPRTSVRMADSAASACDWCRTRSSRCARVRATPPKPTEPNTEHQPRPRTTNLGPRTSERCEHRTSK